MTHLGMSLDRHVGATSATLHCAVAYISTWVCAVRMFSRPLYGLLSLRRCAACATYARRNSLSLCSTSYPSATVGIIAYSSVDGKLRSNDPAHNIMNDATSTGGLIYRCIHTYDPAHY